MNNSSDKSSIISECLLKLCSTLSTDPVNSFELAVTYLSTTLNGKKHTQQDEFSLRQKIYANLAKKCPSNADKFNDCYHKIKNSLVLSNRVAILSLLLALSDSGQQSQQMQQLFPKPKLVDSSTALKSESTSKTTLDSVSSENLLQRLKIQGNPGTSVALHIPMASYSPSSERQCIREVVLAATGVKTNGIPSASRPLQAIYARISHLGILHDQLKEFIDPASKLMPEGSMREGLFSAIRDELTEYYRSVAILQSQVNDCDGGGATLRRLCVWAQDPLHRLTWLATIAHAAQLKKGGELASCVHCFVRHGDERVSTLARRLLNALTYPLLIMLTRWLSHGELDDPYNEFFIESRSPIPIDRLWHDKYKVRERLVPSFMSVEQAAQILATGKSVVFMREACADDYEPTDHSLQLDRLLKPQHAGVASECWWEAAELGVALAGAHDAASARLVSALLRRHHLLDHLVAHRRYLLLAQGDFVHHLVTLMQDVLNKPATSLYVHNLTSILEAAVRATNAHHEPSHVLSRLHVNLYPNCDGRGAEDSGWDVFVLQYRVDGPLGTLFPATCAASYRALFSQLWRVKRTEYALHEAWRGQQLLHKRLRRMPEVRGLLRHASVCLASCMRVCACLQESVGLGACEAWAALDEALRQKSHLDQLIALHQAALDKHAVHALIHDSTQELQSYLMNVLNEMLALKSFKTALHSGINAELDRREQIEKMKADRVAQGTYATTAEDEAKDKEKRKIFLQFLMNKKADLNVWTRTFRGHVTTFILKLALHAEVSLQTLAFRLDYSDFYKRSDAKLHQPLTYQHKRLSEIGTLASKNNHQARLKKNMHHQQ